MEKIKDFVGNCIDYLKANPALAIVLAGAVAFILIVLTVIIVLCVKRSKAKKRLAQKANADKAQATPVTQAQSIAQAQTQNQAQAPAEQAKSQAEIEKEKQEEARKAVFARLEAQRLEAEREEAEERAKAEAEAKAKAKAEKSEKKTATPKKTTAKSTSAKSTTATKTAKSAKTATPATTEEKPATAKKTTKPQPKKAETSVKLYDEMKDAKVEDDIWYDENEAEKVAKYSGKWTICRVITDDAESEETYFFELHASNGEKLFSSEEYTSYNGALRGIETHKANIEKGNFKVTVSKKGDYIFKLLSGKNTLLCMGENYATQARCESAIESTKRFAKTAVLDESIQDHLVKVPVEDDAEIEPANENYNGKWIIFSRLGINDEKLFYFELFANNGEKLLSSEDYTSYVGAVNGLQTHKANIEKGNFRISLTKRGDYIYKLLNGNNQLLCLGEHYKTKRRCQNAVESVKRFAISSPVLADPSLTK